MKEPLVLEDQSRIFLYPLINYVHTEICKIVLQTEKNVKKNRGKGPKPADKKDGDFPFFSYL